MKSHEYSLSLELIRRIRRARFTDASSSLRRCISCFNSRTCPDRSRNSSRRQRTSRRQRNSFRRQRNSSRLSGASVGSMASHAKETMLHTLPTLWGLLMILTGICNRLCMMCMCASNEGLKGFRSSRYPRMSSQAYSDSKASNG